MTSRSGGGGAEPDPKKRRLLDAGGPIEDDEIARQKMRDAQVYERGVDGTAGDYVGFDPDNVADVKSFSFRGTSHIRPMAYFAKKGDLPMMRWLYVNGADTRDGDANFFFPMFMSATNGHNGACKWLFEHGAAKDVKRKTSRGGAHGNGTSPLYAAFGSSFRRDLSRWLILNGALCKDDESGELGGQIMKEDLYPITHDRVRERNLLLEWANDLHRARTSFLLFLSGALSSAPQHANRSCQNLSQLKVLSGKAGVLELIGDYAGVVRGREAKIVRQLTEMIPKLFSGFRVAESSGESSSSDESSSEE